MRESTVKSFLGVMRVPAEMCNDNRRMHLVLRLVSINHFMAGQYLVRRCMSLPLMGLSSLRIIRCFSLPSGESLEGNSLEKTSEYCFMNAKLSSL